MYCACPISVIDKPHNRFAALDHLECRAGHLAIVTDESCLAKLRVDLLHNGFDIDFVVIDCFARAGVGECPAASRSAFRP